MYTDEQFARTRELLRLTLQAVREVSDRDRATVYRYEIVLEGEAMGLSEEEAVELTRMELEQNPNWFVLSPYVWSAERGFLGAEFTDHKGHRRLFR